MDQKIQPTEKELHSRIKNNEGKIIKLNQTLLNQNYYNSKYLVA